MHIARSYLLRGQPSTIVRPQITYQLPLNYVPYLFDRLALLKHPFVMSFLSLLDGKEHIYDTYDISTSQETVAKLKNIEGEIIKIEETIKNSKNSKSLRKSKKEKDLDDKKQDLLKDHKKLITKHNIAQKNILGKFFRENFSKMIMSLKNKQDSKNLLGFLYLFLFYWYRLFNNNQGIESSEEGPKSELAVMLRIPMSQVYQLLDEDEKKILDTLLYDITRKYGKDWVIKEYYLNEDEKIWFLNNSKYNIETWYSSIKNLDKDFLSPPPYMNEDYSMGALSVQNGSVIIEMRGYAMIATSLVNLQNFSSFIKEEAEWFYNLRP